MLFKCCQHFTAQGPHYDVAQRHRTDIIKKEHVAAIYNIVRRRDYQESRI
jgi:hypothetical protein